MIFEAWPLDQRQGTRTFRELLDIRLTSTRERESVELEAVLVLSERITEMRLRHRMLPTQRDELQEHEMQLAKLDAQIQGLTSSADKKSADRLRVVSSALRILQEEVQELDRRRTSLQGLQSAVQSARSTSFPQLLERLRSEYRVASLTDLEWAAFKIEFAGDVGSTLTRVLTQVEDNIAKLTGTPVDEPEAAVALDELAQDELNGCSVIELKAVAKRLERLVGLDAERSKQLRGLTEAASKARAQIARLTSDIKRAENESTDELVTRRREHYEAYFKALLDEEEELGQLYAPLDEVSPRVWCLGREAPLCGQTSC